MKTSDLAVIEGFHRKLIAEYGGDSIDAVGWLSDASQKARYRVLANLDNFNGKSILDAGCGHADLFGYLHEAYSNIDYYGIDQLAVLLNVAIKRYSHLPGTHFLQGDFSKDELPVTDYVIACGSLSYRTSFPRYIFTMIEKLFRHSRIGFGFNFLSALKYPDPAIVSYNPDTILDYCRTLSKKIKYEVGYWENDFTVMMYH